MARSAFESLFMHAPIPLIVVDGPALRIEHANRAAHKLVGKEKVAGESLLAALPELEEQGCSQWLRDALARGGLQACEYPLRRAASVGASTYWTVLCRQLEERGAHPQGVVVLIDTTTQTLAQRELEQRAAKADAESRAKDEFVAMLSHELRHPISPVVQALALMRLRGMDTQEQAVIERQVNHLMRLINDLLDMARIERGIVRLEKRKLELHTIVTEALEMVEPLVENRGQRVRVDVPKDLRADVDPDRMRQVVSNLLTNAAKYSEAGSEILVSATSRQGKVLFSVVDQGIGMTPATLAALFEPDGSTKHVGPKSGLGLGLVIVRKLIRQHGGDVHAYSDGPGSGSRFVVELPSADAGSEKSEAS